MPLQLDAGLPVPPRREISQMGGQKRYSVKGKDPKLIEFMDAVNGRLA